MNTPRVAALALALTLPIALLAAGCGVTEGTVPPPTPSSPSQPAPVAGSGGSVTISPQYVALSPGEKIHFDASSSSGGALQWSVNGVAGGDAADGVVDSSGNYTAPPSLSQSANFTVTASLVGAPKQDYASAVASVIDPGVIYPTANPQVDQYSIYLPAPGNVSIQFGKTTSYGLNTWRVATPSANGGQVSIYVAGMQATTLYHMRAQVALNNGATFTDVDHDTFVSGQPLVTGTPPVTSPVKITQSGTPQPGIELFNTILPGNVTQAFATDLQGHVIWTYTYQGGSKLDSIQGIHLLPNGDFLMTISYLSSLTTKIINSQPTTLNLVREVDLAGNTVRQITMDQLNQRLAADGFHNSSGNPYTLKNFHHDVLALPNGHWVLLCSYPKDFTNLPGHPGTTQVLGDVLVDVDQNGNPDWLWDAFDHLSVNRHPLYFPDWTHSNDMLYSTDDHNLLLSMRHQNWIIKIAFDDGKGSGNVLWRLGYGGDFKLLNAKSPQDWFYAQHGMNYFTSVTTGVFRIGMMDNGNDRFFPPPIGQVICKPQAPTNPYCYSTAPVLEVNEGNMTATMIVNYTPPPSYFSFFGGDLAKLPNGDIHVDFCAPLSGSIIQELNPTATRVIWQATTPGADQFRADRLPSLYPGVQW